MMSSKHNYTIEHNIKPVDEVFATHHDKPSQPDKIYKEKSPAERLLGEMTHSRMKQPVQSKPTVVKRFQSSCLCFGRKGKSINE